MVGLKENTMRIWFTRIQMKMMPSLRHICREKMVGLKISFNRD